MARGIIYHITTDPEKLGSMSEYNFYDHIESLHAEYVVDRDTYSAQNDLDSLREELKANGFDIQKEILKDADEQPAFVIYTGNKERLEKAKMKYFSHCLTQLKDRLETLSLKEFATDTGIVYELSQHINDTYSDAVYLDMGTGGSTYTMHQFLRNLEENHVYYVSTNTVLMH